MEKKFVVLEKILRAQHPNIEPSERIWTLRLSQWPPSSPSDASAVMNSRINKKIWPQQMDSFGHRKRFLGLRIPRVYSYLRMAQTLFSGESRPVRVVWLRPRRKDFLPSVKLLMPRNFCLLLNGLKPLLIARKWSTNLLSSGEVESGLLGPYSAIQVYLTSLIKLSVAYPLPVN